MMPKLVCPKCGSSDVRVDPTRGVGECKRCGYIACADPFAPLHEYWKLKEAEGG